MTEKATKTKDRPILFSGPMVVAILEGQKTQTRRVPNERNCVFGSAPPAFWDHADFSKAWVDGKGSGDEYLHVPAHEKPCDECAFYGWGGTSHRLRFRSSPGDRLWVREKFTLENGCGEYEIKEPTDGTPFKTVKEADEDGGEREVIEIPHYQATEPDAEIYPWACLEGDCGHDDGECHAVWKPSIHMPRWASRIDLEVVKMRAERLQDISEADAIAEGIEAAEGKADGGFWMNYLTGKWEFPAEQNQKGAIDSYKSLWESINGHGSWSANPWVWVVEFKRVRP